MGTWVEEGSRVDAGLLSRLGSVLTSSKTVYIGGLPQLCFDMEPFSSVSAEGLHFSAFHLCLFHPFVV